MICINQKCPSGVRTPVGCAAIGHCADARPVKTVLDTLKKPEKLAALLMLAAQGREELPWYKWACKRCGRGGGELICEREDGCPWEEEQLIRTWLMLPEKEGWA